MNRWRTRKRSISMTCVAAVMMFVGYALATPTPVTASFCCEVCEGNLEAGYEGCDNLYGDTDYEALMDCYSDIEDAMYLCFAHCDIECYPPGCDWHGYCVVEPPTHVLYCYGGTFICP